MKIYLYRYKSICEPDIINSFKRLGFDVYEETIGITKKELSISENIQITSKKLLSDNYMFVFSINFFPWLSDVCNIMKLPYISLIVDSPVLTLYSNSLQNAYNRIFIFDKTLFNEFFKLNPNNIFHIPLATNVSRTDELINNSSNSVKQHFACDISFIGSTYQEKCSYNDINLPDYERGFVQGLIEAQLKIYGYNFIEDVISDDFVNNFIKYTPYSQPFPENYSANYRAIIAQYYLSVKVAEQERLRILKMLSDNFNVDIYTGSDTSSMPNIHNKGFADSLQQMPIIFNQSKINLNITSKSIRSGLPLRIFDVLGCQGFLITNYQAEIPEIFEIGKDLVTYDSMQDLKDKCHYYLTHNQERIEIAQNGYEKVKKLHTYDVRLTEILKLSFRL